MSGILKIAGSYAEVGEAVGAYWGNYFALLKNSTKDGNLKMYKQYKEWLTEEREDLGTVQQAVQENFPNVWQEICGMHEGVNRSNIGFTVPLANLFACCMAESDENYSSYAACSTAVMRNGDEYLMVHSDEYDRAYPLLSAEVSVLSGRGEMEIFSLSHPFQLLGSAAGFNRAFAVQGNSIGCDNETFRAGKKRVPKTVFSRVLLEEDTPEAAAELYRRYPCSLPNHHLFITAKGAYSLEVRPRPEGAPDTQVSLNPLTLRHGQKFCHTNHFKVDAVRGSVSGKWTYKDKTESPARLRELEEKVADATDCATLEGAFQSFITTYRPSPRKRHQNAVLGYFTFGVSPAKKPHLRSAVFCFGT